MKNGKRCAVVTGAARGMLAKVAVLALGARVEGWREVFAELGRRAMPAAEQIGRAHV